MFKKLRNKLLKLNIIIISIVMLVAFSLIYVFTYNNINIENSKELQRVPLSSFNSFRKPVEDYELESNDEYFSGKASAFNLLLDEDNNIKGIGSYLEYDNEIYEDILNIILNDYKTSGKVTYDNNVWLYEISEFNDNVWIRELSEIKNDLNLSEEYSENFSEVKYRVSFLNVTNDESTLNTLLISLVFIFVIMLIIIYFISLYFANKAIKPLDALWNKQKQFVADATHELKTPLTIINANTDLLLLNEDKKIKSQKKWLEYIKSETKGMNKLINELLTSAKSEEEKYNYKLCNISNIINEIIVTFETIIYEKNIKFKINVENNIKLSCDVEKLRQVIIILLDNAIKYVDDKGNISIELYKKNKNIFFEISNSGYGIEAYDLEHIFERFYKSDKARTNNNSNSYGLGLYIAKTIISKLKGSITCKSEINEKTTFIIKF